MKQLIADENNIMTVSQKKVADFLNERCSCSVGMTVVGKPNHTEPKAEPIEFHEMIKNRRNQLSLSQRTVAALAGLSHRYIQNVENIPCYWMNSSFTNVMSLLRALEFDVQIVLNDILES